MQRMLRPPSLMKALGCRRVPCVRVSARSTAQAARPPKGASEDFQKRGAALQELIQDTVGIVASTGPRGLLRGVQAAQAVVSLGAEYAARGQLDEPPVVVRRLFEKLGATYIKLGQFIASSPSLFPPEYVAELQQLLDRTEPLPFDQIRPIMEAELQQPLDAVFSFIDPKPLASASVAQVHAAVLRASGKEVVVKVLKPGTEDVLASDLGFVYLVSRFLEFVQPDVSRLSLGPIVSDIRASMLDECDFTKEATHLAQFSDFLDRRGLRGVATCPFVYRQFSSKRVLTMERLTGVPLTDLAAVRGITTRDPEAVLIGALNTWFASVLGCDSFHADVHAGNLLVLSDGRVGFIDFGIVGRISPATWKGLEALVGSMAGADYETMARALATIGVTDTDVDFRAFGRDLESFFTELEQVNTGLVLNSAGPGQGVTASLEVDQAQVNRLLLELVRIGETRGVRFPREFGLLTKQLLYFDRYTRLLAPSLQVFNDDRVRWRPPPGTTGPDFGGMGGMAGA